MSRTERTEHRPRPEDRRPRAQLDPSVVPETGLKALRRAMQGSRGPDAEAAAPAGRRSDHRMTHVAAGVGGHGHRGPRTLQPLADAAEENDHGIGRRVDNPPVVALHRAAMSPRWIAKRQVRPRAAGGVEQVGHGYPTPTTP